MYYVTTVRHVIPVEEMSRRLMRIVLHTIQALNCGFSSVLVNTSDIDVIVILIRQLSCFETIIAECKTTENRPYSRRGHDGQKERLGLQIYCKFARQYVNCDATSLLLHVPVT